MANLKDIGYGVGKYLTASDASDIPDIGTNRKNIDLLNFKVATNNAYALYNFKDGMIDAYQTQDGVDTSGSTNDLYDATTKTYSVNYKTSGGTITTYGAYQVHSFLTTGNTNFVAAGSDNVDVLVVAGGGGAGTFSGGGGGAGGFRTSASHAVTAQTYVVTVGAGGAGGTSGTPAGYTIGTNGGNSVFDTITSAGGGGGMGYTNNAPAAAGGSGGGSGTAAQGYPTGAAGAGNTPSTSPSQGNPGGTGSPRGGYPGVPGGYYGGGGGGGGAGVTGDSAGSSTTGGDGGNGLTNDFRTGSNVTYAGGGSAAGGESQPYGSAGPNGVAGTGGGGQSQAYNASYADAYIPDLPNGEANTGGGGGGGVRNNWGGYGGSGIVVVRFPSAGALGGRGNMTLLSNAQTAQADPTEGRLMLYEEDVDAITLDTDLKGYVSRDGGTTYTQTPLVEDTVYEAFNQGGIDSDTKLMLNCDGVDGGTTFTDASDSAHTITVAGNAHTDTAVKKFGTASAEFDGTTDKLSAASSTDFNPFGVDFTVDFWLNVDSFAHQYDWLIGNSQADPSGWNIQLEQSGSKVNFLVGNGSSWQINTVSSGTGYAISTDTWYHIAVVKNGTAWAMYVDGTSRATGTAAGHDYSAVLDIGGSTLWAGRDFDGYMDEIRVSKGVARWTADFTPPSYPYSDGAYVTGPKRLLSGSVDISGQPAGTDMKYKVETLNNKNLKLHGASLLWA